MKTVKLALALTLSLCLGGTLETGARMGGKEQFQSYPSVFSWTDGLSVDNEQFSKSIKNTSLNTQQKWEYFHYVDLLTGLWIFPDNAVPHPIIIDAFHLRHELSLKLKEVSSEEDFQAWKNDAILSMQQASDRMNKKDIRLFYTFLGMAPISIEQSKAVGRPLFKSAPKQNLSYTPPKPYTDMRVIGPSNAFPVLWEGKKYTKKEALSELRKTLSEAGLAAIRIPLGSVESNEDLVALSQNIKGMSHDLYHRTGFRYALGAKGRVVWSIRRSDSDVINAISMPLSWDYYSIESNTNSYYHEWMHIIQWEMKRTNQLKPLRKLEHNIRREGLTKQQWSTLMLEAQRSTNAFFSTQWGTLHISRDENPKVTYDVAMEKTGTPFNAATAAAHTSWLKSPGANTKVSSWVARRYLADAWLNRSKTQLLAKDKYYSEPDEWVAAAWNGDMLWRKDLMDKSIIHTPLPTEIKAYEKHWNSFFEQTALWWGDIPNVHTENPKNLKNLKNLKKTAEPSSGKDKNPEKGTNG